MVVANAVSGSIAYTRQKRADVPTALLVGIGGLPGSIARALLGRHAPPTGFDAIYGALLLVFFGYILRRRTRPNATHARRRIRRTFYVRVLPPGRHRDRDSPRLHVQLFRDWRRRHIFRRVHLYFRYAGAHYQRDLDARDLAYVTRRFRSSCVSRRHRLAGRHTARRRRDARRTDRTANCTAPFQPVAGHDPRIRDFPRGPRARTQPSLTKLDKCLILIGGIRYRLVSLRSLGARNTKFRGRTSPDGTTQT